MARQSIPDARAARNPEIASFVLTRSRRRRAPDQGLERVAERGRHIPERLHTGAGQAMRTLWKTWLGHWRRNPGTAASVPEGGRIPDFPEQCSV